MKLHLRWQILLALLGFSLVFALLSYQVQTVSTFVCTTVVPANGGTFIEGTIGGPRVLNPLLSDGYPVEQQLVDLIFDGLTRLDASGQLQPALAESWQVDEDGLTYRFSLRSNVVWHDGTPFTARDVAFTYGLLQDEAFAGAPGLKILWQAVTIMVSDDYTIDFQLPEPYAPFLEATTRGILPSHKLSGITAVSLTDHQFNQFPTGTGPFMVDPSLDWQRTGRLRLIPSPNVWQQGTKISNLEFRFYPDRATLLEAFEAGTIHAISDVPHAILPAIARQPDSRLFSARLPQYASLLFNLGETGNPALQPVTMRQALAYGLNRSQLIDKVLNGQGLIREGPFLPASWAYNPRLTTQYTYQPITATALLEQNGWVWNQGQPARQKDETILQIQLLTLSDPTLAAAAQTIKDQWEEFGIGVELTLVDTLPALRETLAAHDFDVALVEIDPPNDPDLYDFWSQEAIIRGQNYGWWNNRRASEALENGRKILAITDRKPYYATFLRQFNNDLPALTLYQPTTTYALSTAVNQAEIGRIFQPRDRYLTLANWFLLYREVSATCPENETAVQNP